MFRGFESILRGRHPLDAQHITQRICGVCPISHGVASILAQDAAYGIQPPENGRLVRNLILGANFIQSHLIHFYHLSALDFVDIEAVTQYRGRDTQLAALRDWITAELDSGVLYPVAPFLPRYAGGYVEDAKLNTTAVKHYVEAFAMRALAHKAAALFCGKIPHAATLMPGGVTEQVTVTKIAAYAANMKRLRAFIDTCYLPDVLAVARALPQYFSLGKGPENYLAYGVFRESAEGGAKLFPSGAIVGGVPSPFEAGRIAEDVKRSLFSSASGLDPARGETVPEPGKGGAYSWIKAPRYDGHAMEVGPLARVLVAYESGNAVVKEQVDGLLAKLGGGLELLNSVWGRHAARVIECKILADRCVKWAEQLKPGEPAFADFDVPESGKGVGLTEAPRGALGHWLTIQNRRIANYQCVVPTTWNCSPRDDKDVPGPIEQALVGTPIADPDNPIEAARVVRAFDPCIACAVH
jgi:ferredoxin hydrogenase large subunit/hydrogenase large subunit